jgi:hypothetical protein
LVNAAGETALKIAEQREPRCESVIGVLADATYEASIAKALADAKRLKERKRKDRLWEELGRKLEAEAIGRARDLEVEVQWSKQ